MDYRPYLILGAIVNSALYLAAVVMIAAFEHNSLALHLGIAAFGTTFLAYCAQLSPVPAPGTVLVWASITVGAAAGLALL